MKTITHNGLTFSVVTPQDVRDATPWEDDCIYDGVVSDWERREKMPHERILSSDRTAHLFFDVKQYLDVAVSHGCTRKQGFEQLERSFKHLQAWCNDQWFYVGVVVTLLDSDGDETDISESLWGIESDAYDYIDEVAHELAEQMAGQAVPKSPALRQSEQIAALRDAITGLLECTGLNMDDMEGDTIYMIENARAVLADIEVAA